ncbi:MAG: glycosyltransferase family 4 protein, partial [Armatimonadota bacterium]
MRVLLQSPAPDHPGGDTSHLIEKTREYLAAVGVAADHTCELEPDLAGYDLVHLFGAPKMDDLLTQCANAQRQCKPLVFSAQYWDEGRLPECLGAEQPLPTAVRLAHSFGDHLYRVVLGEADVVLTASQMEGGWLTRDMGVAPEQQRVVPLAAESFFAAADAEPFVERVGVRDFVLCSAVLARPKNQLRLIRALRGFNTPLVLAYPSAEDGYERRCREEAGDDVIFVGRLDPDELASAYAAAKVHALVSCYEPTGMSSIEAGLAGCNLVCTAHSPISEYVGNRAWYADPLDVAAIRRAVELAHRVPKSHILRNELLANFTWERTARLTLAAYEGLLAVGHAAAHRKGEARYRWLTACRRSVGELRDRVMAVTAAADAASAASAPARAQARIDTLTRSLRERDEQLQAITDTWAYRLHHYLATSAPARALRHVHDPGPPPVFHAPRGPALDALGHRAEDIQRVLVVAEASAWHVLRA